jgi:hypothetical protein
VAGRNSKSAVGGNGLSGRFYGDPLAAILQRIIVVRDMIVGARARRGPEPCRAERPRHTQHALEGTFIPAGERLSPLSMQILAP